MRGTAGPGLPCPRRRGGGSEALEPLEKWRRAWGRRRGVEVTGGKTDAEGPERLRGLGWLQKGRTGKGWALGVSLVDLPFGLSLLARPICCGVPKPGRLVGGTASLSVAGIIRALDRPCAVVRLQRGSLGSGRDDGARGSSVSFPCSPERDSGAFYICFLVSIAAAK